MDISEQLKKAAKNAILPISVMLGGSANAEPVQVPEPSEKIATNEQPVEKVAFIHENGDSPSQEIIDEAVKSGRLKEYIMKDEVYDLYSTADNSFLSNFGLKSSPPIYYDTKPDPNQKATANLVTTNEGNSIVIINNNALEINKSEKLTYSYDNADKYELTEITKENNHGFSSQFFDKYQEMAEKTGINPPKLYFDKKNSGISFGGLMSSNSSLRENGIIFIGKNLDKITNADEQKTLAALSHEFGHIKYKYSHQIEALLAIKSPELNKGLEQGERIADCNAVSVGQMQNLSEFFENADKIGKSDATHGDAKYRISQMQEDEKRLAQGEDCEEIHPPIKTPPVPLTVVKSQGK